MNQPYTENLTHTTKDYAKAYVKMGMRVIPIVPKGKVPLIQGWQEWAACHDTEESISLDWVWEGCNIGIVTGAVSKIFVVDIDQKHDGMDHWKKWEREVVGRELITPWRVLTGGGGYHLYFRFPDIDLSETVELTNKVGVLQGVDFRGNGGFVVAPPSIHASGKEYLWEM